MLFGGRTLSASWAATTNSSSNGVQDPTVLGFTLLHRIKQQQQAGQQGCWQHLEVSSCSPHSSSQAAMALEARGSRRHGNTTSSTTSTHWWIHWPCSQQLQQLSQRPQHRKETSKTRLHVLLQHVHWVTQLPGPHKATQQPLVLWLLLQVNCLQPCATAFLANPGRLSMWQGRPTQQQEQRLEGRQCRSGPVLPLEGS